MGGRRGRRETMVILLRARSLAAVVVLALGACDHENELPSAPPQPPPTRAETAATLLRIELDTRLLRLRADDPSLPHYTARMNALDALLAHIAVTTRFLEENRLHAARVGTDLAGITYDLMRTDHEASVRQVGGSARTSCNGGIKWAGIGIQGLARDPGWADQTEEVEQALSMARWHRDNALRAVPIATFMRPGVVAASIPGSVASAIGLVRSGLTTLVRLSAWMKQGGAAYGVLLAAPKGGPAIQLVTRGGGALVLTHAEVIALVNAGQLSATAAALHMMAAGQPPKLPVQGKAFEEWARKLPTRQTPNTTPHGK